MKRITVATDQGKDVDYLELGLKLGNVGFNKVYEVEDVYLFSQEEIEKEHIKSLITLAATYGMGDYTIQGTTYRIE